MILDLYDPDRSRSPARREGETWVDIAWSDVIDEVQQGLKDSGDGSGVAVLARADFITNDAADERVIVGKVSPVDVV